MPKNNISNLQQLFNGFDYKKYWDNWKKEHPNQNKEIDFGKPVGKEIKW